MTGLMSCASMTQEVRGNRSWVWGEVRGRYRKMAGTAANTELPGRLRLTRATWSRCCVTRFPKDLARESYTSSGGRSFADALRFALNLSR